MATSSFMLSSPKYFHPNRMSPSEKQKVDLKKLRNELKIPESDCGSSRAQVAQLTIKIKHLTTAVHKKDKQSVKGLRAMVQKRKKLLKYLGSKGAQKPDQTDPPDDPIQSKYPIPKKTKKNSKK